MYDRVGLLSVNGRRKVAGDGCKGYIFLFEVTEWGGYIYKRKFGI